MKAILSFILLSLLFINSFSQSCNNQTNKILLIGDSWSFLPSSFNTFTPLLEKYGFTDANWVTSPTLSVNGKKTPYLLEAGVLSEIATVLQNNPDINIINVSIGGNDLLRNWTVNTDPQTFDSILDAIIDRERQIALKLDSIKPGIQLYYPKYDYPNFKETINRFAPFEDQHPFYDAWDDMGKPNFTQINNALLKYDQKVAPFVNSLSFVHSYTTTGLMQFIYGQTSPLEVAPGGTYPPGSVPFPGGDPNYPSPIPSMNTYVAFVDAFHVGQGGYRHLYNYHFKKWYWKALRETDSTFTSMGGTKDGFVTDLITGNNSLTVGIDSVTNYKAIFSFNTATIDDFRTPNKSSIFIKRDSLRGNKPFNGKIILSISSSFFGSSDDVELADFNDNGDLTDTACVYGTINNNESWLRIDLPQAMLPYINKTGLTQFKIKAIDTTNSRIHFATGNQTETAPQLDVRFDGIASVKENIANQSFTVFPNPSNQNNIQLNLPYNISQKAQFIGLDGKTTSLEIINNQVNVQPLTSGIYILKFYYKNTIFTSKFVKLN